MEGLDVKVLVACEFSGVVRDAFIAKGHDAVSCDLLPTETPGPHIQGDVRGQLHKKWDLVVAFPPCTHLSASGARYWPGKQADGRQQAAVNFVRDLWFLCEQAKVCIENPVGILSTVWRKPTQIIQPYQFGDPVRKKTCLWLSGLPPLKATRVVEPKYALGTNSYHGGPRKDGTRKRCELKLKYGDGRRRSVTQQGIADAMAEQWGSL